MHHYGGSGFIFYHPLGILLVLRLKKPHLQAPGSSVVLGEDVTAMDIE